MADGQLEFRIVDVTETDIVTEVVVGGSMGSRKGVNMPGADIALPSVTEVDPPVCDTMKPVTFSTTATRSSLAFPAAVRRTFAE